MILKRNIENLFEIKKIKADFIWKSIDRYGIYKSNKSIKILKQKIQEYDFLDVTILEKMSKVDKELIADALANSILICLKKWKLTKTSLLENFWTWLLFRICFYANDEYHDLVRKLDSEKIITTDSLTKQIQSKFYHRRMKYEERDILNSVSEYFLLKNLNTYITNIPLSQNNLELQWLFVAWENCKGKEQKRWNIDLDKNWEETNIRYNGLDFYSEIMENKKIINHLSPYSYKDASWERYCMYLDAPCGVWLFYKWKPICEICFYIDNGYLFINQIQKTVHYEYDRYGRMIGNKYSSKVPKNWETLLFKSVENIAKQHWCKWIIIQSWKNNRWTTEFYTEDSDEDWRKIITDIPHLSQQVAEKIYDVFAKKEWFIYDEQSWNRKKSLEIEN